ncbi:hypothetical protein Tco_1243337 [Tanacetum coccineum]
MAIMNSCNKHNMIACVEKTERNADFHGVIDFLTRCTVNYALLVSPDVIQQWVQQFWSTAKVRMINEVAHIEAKVAGKKILVSEASDQFGTNISSALVGLATNQKFNFSKLIFDGMLRNLKDSKPFLMYPRFIQLFLNKQLEGRTKPQTFLPTVVLPPKVFTFMSKCSPKFSGKLTPLTPPMLEVATAVRDAHSLHTAELDIPTSSHHSDDSSTGQKAESPSPGASERSASPNDYTPTDEVQTSGGDEGHLDLHGLTRELMFNISDSQMMDVDDTISAKENEGTAQVHEGTAEVNESTAGANLSTEPSMKKVEDEAGPSTFQDESDEFIQDDILIADTLVEITRPRRGAGITIPGNISEQERPESPTQILDPKDKRIRKSERKEKDLLVLKDYQAELEDYEIIAAEGATNRKREILLKTKGKVFLRNQDDEYLKNKVMNTSTIFMKEVKMLNDKFVAIGSTEDEQAIKEMNVKAEEPLKKRKGTI